MKKPPRWVMSHLNSQTSNKRKDVNSRIQGGTHTGLIERSNTQGNVDIHIIDKITTWNMKRQETITHTVKYNNSRVYFRGARALRFPPFGFSFFCPP